MVTFSVQPATAFPQGLVRPRGAADTSARKPIDKPALCLTKAADAAHTMYHAMPSPSPTRWKRALDSVLRFTRLETPASPAGDQDEVEFLRQMCRSLVRDLPAEPRHALEVRIQRARDRSDLWNLRSHLFGAVSLQFGEHAARERLQQLDTHWQ